MIPLFLTHIKQANGWHGMPGKLNIPFYSIWDFINLISLADGNISQWIDSNICLIVKIKIKIKTVKFKNSGNPFRITTVKI